MKFKKIMLVALLLAVLTIGAASAAEDVDGLAADDVGDDNVVESPVDDTMASGGDDDASPDVNDYISMYSDEVTSRNDEICMVHDYDDSYGSASVYVNKSLVYNKTFSSNYVFISAKDLKGTFNGTYALKVIYNKPDGTKWFKEQNVTFDNIVGKTEIKVNASDFNVTFPDRDLDVDVDVYSDAVKFFVPLYVTEGWVEIRYGDGEYDVYEVDIYESWAGSDYGVYLCYLCNAAGEYNLTVTYANDDGYSKELARSVLKVVKNYSPDDFIKQWKNEVSSSYNSIWKIEDDASSKLDGVVTIFDENGSVAYNKSFSGEETYEYITADNLVGKFNGTCNFTVVYKRAADGKEYAKNSTVNFLIAIVNILPVPEDFNVVITEDEIDINDETTPVVSFDWPDYVEEYDGGSYNNKAVMVDVAGGSNYLCYRYSGETSGNVTLDKLYIFEPGTYNITVYYDDNFKIAEGKIKVSKTYTSNDFIELYSKQMSDPTDYVCNVYDSTDSGFKGNVAVYAGGNTVFTKAVNGEISSLRINWQDLTTNLNGTYAIKVVYQRASDGKEYSKTEQITFVNNTGNTDPSAPAASDFNVRFADTEINVDDDDAVAVSFDWPEYTKLYAVIHVYVDGDFANLFQKMSDSETSRNITPGELRINYKGTYNISVTYGWDEMEIAKGTIKTTQTPRNYTGDDFIEIPPIYPVDEDDWFCTVNDYVEGYDVGLNGESYLYINGTLAYYNKFTGNGTIAKALYAGKDLAGSFNGTYPVKYVYKRATDGKEYVKELDVSFFNFNGNGAAPEVTPSNTTKPVDTTPAKPAETTPSQPAPSAPTTQAPAETIKLTLKTVKVKKSAKSLVLQVTLKVNGKAVKNKKVTFKFNGKKYTGKTNAKGIAKVTVKKSVLKKLKVGKKVTYQVTYGKTTVKKSVKVKK